MNTTFSRRLALVLLVFVFQIVNPSAARAADDEVLYWNAVGVRAMQVAPAVGGALQPRVLAVMHASIFDAVNGIERRYQPIHIDAHAPRSASRRAAAAQAAYTALTLLFPAQAAAHAFDADLAASLAGIAADAENENSQSSADAENENSQSIERGRDWGELVANLIFTWCQTDRVYPLSTYSPPVPDPGPGRWRPTLPANAAGLFLSFATARPFILPDPPIEFRPSGPPQLWTTEYAADVNEVQSVGALSSTTRTADQTQSARFWAGAAASVWNRAAVNAAKGRHRTLLQNARLFAMLNMAMSDALLVGWDAKYHFLLWRPITAIRLADTDSNPGTTKDATWLPLISTPAYPEYYSGHQSISGTAQAILTAFFGNRTPVVAFSESLPGVERSWPNFAAAADEAYMARIWSGIHFRFAMRDTRQNTGRIAAYVLAHAMRPKGEQTGQNGSDR
jgi:hypothetical protein